MVDVRRLATVERARHRPAEDEAEFLVELKHGAGGLLDRRRVERLRALDQRDVRDRALRAGVDRADEVETLDAQAIALRRHAPTMVRTSARVDLTCAPLESNQHTRVIDPRWRHSQTVYDSGSSPLDGLIVTKRARFAPETSRQRRPSIQELQRATSNVALLQRDMRTSLVVALLALILGCNKHNVAIGGACEKAEDCDVAGRCYRAPDDPAGVPGVCTIRCELTPQPGSVAKPCESFHSGLVCKTAAKPDRLLGSTFCVRQ